MGKDLIASLSLPLSSVTHTHTAKKKRKEKEKSTTPGHKSFAHVTAWREMLPTAWPIHVFYIIINIENNNMLAGRRRNNERLARKDLVISGIN